MAACQEDMYRNRQRGWNWPAGQCLPTPDAVPAWYLLRALASPVALASVLLLERSRNSPALEAVFHVSYALEGFPLASPSPPSSLRSNPALAIRRPTEASTYFQPSSPHHALHPSYFFLLSFSPLIFFPRHIY